MAKFEIVWEAPEYEYREKEISWYWISIIVSALIIAFSVWERNFLFGFFIVIAEILFIVWGNRMPEALAFSVTDQAVTIEGRKSYSMSAFDAWSADPDGADFTDIAFYFHSKIRPPLVLLFPAEELAEFRVNMKGVLKEIEHQGTLIDSIEKFLRF